MQQERKGVLYMVGMVFPSAGVLGVPQGGLEQKEKLSRRDML